MERIEPLTPEERRRLATARRWRIFGLCLLLMAWLPGVATALVGWLHPDGARLGFLRWIGLAVAVLGAVELLAQRRRIREIRAILDDGRKRVVRTRLTAVAIAGSRPNYRLRLTFDGLDTLTLRCFHRCVDGPGMLHDWPLPCPVEVHLACAAPARFGRPEPAFLRLRRI